MSAIAVIPARGGSQRIPRKNIKLFHGKPIIAYSILAAKASGLFDEIIVSTDDDEIERVALKTGADIFRRDQDNGERGTQAVTTEVLRDCDTDEYEYACCIYATAPLLTSADLLAGWLSLDNHHPYAYVPGLYYWGRTDAFLNGIPLSRGFEVPFHVSRYIDINTEQDWHEAEIKYGLHELEMMRPFPNLSEDVFFQCKICKSTLPT